PRPPRRPGSPARARSFDDRAPRAGRVARHAADELVVDRAGDAGVVLGEDAVPEQDDRRAGRKLAVELDGKRVHGDGADDAPRLAGDADLRSGHVPPEPVPVADRHEPDPGRLLGRVAAAVAGALARLE